jgi:hypothetical protein
MEGLRSGFRSKRAFRLGLSPRAGATILALFRKKWGVSGVIALALAREREASLWLFPTSGSHRLGSFSQAEASP